MSAHAARRLRMRGDLRSGSRYLLCAVPGVRRRASLICVFLSDARLQPEQRELSPRPRHPHSTYVHISTATAPDMHGDVFCRTKCNILIQSSNQTFGYISASWNDFGEYGIIQRDQSGTWCSLEMATSYLTAWRFSRGLTLFLGDRRHRRT
jgi:hypothetical protein